MNKDTRYNTLRTLHFRSGANLKGFIDCWIKLLAADRFGTGISTRLIEATVSYILSFRRNSDIIVKTMISILLEHSTSQELTGKLESLLDEFEKE